MIYQNIKFYVNWLVSSSDVAHFIKKEWCVTFATF
jgi:hypothetical protein